MLVTLDIPEDIAQALETDSRAVPRAALESIALEGYRSGRFSDEQVRRLLGVDSQFAVHVFLKEHGVYLNYTQEDLEQDLAFGEAWLSSQTPRR